MENKECTTCEQWCSNDCEIGLHVYGECGCECHNEEENA